MNKKEIKIRKAEISNLPKTTGVYLFYDKKGKILYIGKATNIKERVKSHFKTPAFKDGLFLEKVEKIGFKKTDSEIEALLKEAELIKKHQPKFNVLWRDDKNYFFVAVTKEDFPRIFITHQLKQKLEIRNSKLELPGYDVTPEETITKAIEAGCQSIAYTYTEPTIFFEFALDCMKLARQNGLKNIWVSNGYMSKQCLDEILPYLDAINVDLKFFDEKIYLKNCGCHLPPILDNLKYLYKDSRFKTQDSKLILEITTLLIPGLTDVNNQPQKIAEFIAQELSPNVPWHISRFSPDISYKMQNGQDTPLKLINRAYELGKRAGLNYIYVGNIWNNEHESTYCPQCGALVIKRLGYQIKALTPDGHCPKCYYQLPLRII